MSRPPVLFVHGAWVNGRCFEGFEARYRARGYETFAPSWPGDERDPADLRANPDPKLGELGITAILDHYEGIARGLSAPPLLIGHSFGGLFVQLLLSRGVGCGAVAIHPAPPAGVLPSWSALKASWPVVSTWGHWNKVIPMSFADWVWCFAHQLDADAQKASYERYVCPTPGRVYFEAATKPALVTPDFAKSDRGALLIVSGDADRTVTADMNAKNHALYAKSSAVTELRPMAGRSHFTLGEPGWEAVADGILDWSEAKLGLEPTVAS